MYYIHASEKDLRLRNRHPIQKQTCASETDLCLSNKPPPKKQAAASEINLRFHVIAIVTHQRCTNRHSSREEGKESAHYYWAQE